MQEWSIPAKIAAKNFFPGQSSITMYKRTVTDATMPFATVSTEVFSGTINSIAFRSFPV
jgi:hypothetical protein